MPTRGGRWPWGEGRKRLLNAYVHHRLDRHIIIEYYLMSSFFLPKETTAVLNLIYLVNALFNHSFHHNATDFVICLFFCSHMIY